MSSALPAADSAVRRYAVFISYRHADNLEMGRKWANWLHEALESYEVPPDLIGKTSLRGDKVPASLYPVFRDEAELPADADLSRDIRRALEHSGLLVVLCSPRAVQSKFVADEIRYFKELGKSDRILALMIDGEPNASDDPAKGVAFGSAAECFPEPLRFGVAGEGDATKIDWSAGTEPIAADVRPEGRCVQGWTTAAAYREQLVKDGGMTARQMASAVREYNERLELAKLKIIAGAVGLPLGELTQRDKAFQLAKAKRRQKLIATLAVVFGVLLVVAVAGALYARSESAMRARLLEDVARADRATAQDLNQQGEVSPALAYLARAIRNFPADPAAAQSAVMILNQWPYLAPWNSVDARGVAVEFSPSGKWVACVKDEAGHAGVGVSLLSDPARRVFLPSPFGSLRLGVRFLDEARLEVSLREAPPEDMPPATAARRLWNFTEAMGAGGSPADFLSPAPPEKSETPGEVETSDDTSVWHGSGITARDAAGRLIFERTGGEKTQAAGRNMAASLHGGVFSKEGGTFFAVAVAEGDAKRTISAWSTLDGRLLYAREVMPMEDAEDQVDLTQGTWFLSPFGDAFVLLDDESAAVGRIGAERAEILRIERLTNEEGQFSEAAFSPDGAHVAVGLCLYGIDKVEMSVAKVYWTATAELDGETPARWGYRANTHLRWSPDGASLVLNASMDAWQYEEVWHAPAAPLFAKTRPVENLSGKVKGAVQVMDGEGKAEQSVPGVTVLKQAEATVATLHGEVGRVHSWLRPTDEPVVYVFEWRTRREDEPGELWAGRWTLPGGVLQGQKQRVLPNFSGGVVDAEILSTTHQLVIADQVSSWIGDATTLATFRVFQNCWRTASPSLRWHVTEAFRRYDGSELRLVSSATQSETLTFTSGGKSADAVEFRRGGRELYLEARETAQSWELLDAAEPPPEWFSEFLFAVCFQNFDAKGVLNFPFPTAGQVSAPLAANVLADGTQYGQFARWFLQRGSSSAKWPGTAETAREMAVKLLSENTAAALHRSYLLDKTTPGLSAALAKAAANDVAAELHRNFSKQ